MIRINQYRDGAMHVMFKGLTLSVNTPESLLLPPRQFAVKNWSENQKLAQAAEESGLFTPTESSIAIGFVMAPVWEIKEEHPEWLSFKRRTELLLELSRGG